MKFAHMKSFALKALVSSLMVGGLSAVAHADDAPAPAAAPAAAPAPAPAPSFPSMGGALTANAKPFSVDMGPAGTIYIGGAATAVAQVQGNPWSGVPKSQTDVDNAQVFINKIDGLVQFSGQFGSYSIPALGLPYVKADKTVGPLFGNFPQGFIKLAPSDSFSVQVGKLPTLIGAEYTFSYENMNIQRGLLWGQENAVARGIQANYTTGPLALSVALTDGFYSKKYDWASLSATYTADSSNIFSFVAGGNVAQDDKPRAQTATTTPVFQNNGQIYNLIYTHTSGPWTFQPYLQYTYVPSLKGDINGTGATTNSADTIGGALLASYKVNDNISLPVRVEYIASSGDKNNASDINLLGYGNGSKAWSFTFTPTYQYKIFFVRGEASYVTLSDKTAGLGFGKFGNKDGQVTGMLETGILF